MPQTVSRAVLLSSRGALVALVEAKDGGACAEREGCFLLLDHRVHGAHMPVNLCSVRGRHWYAVGKERTESYALLDMESFSSDVRTYSDKDWPMADNRERVFKGGPSDPVV